MHPHYLNAVAVLPPDTLDAVSKALNGRSAFLWIPAHRIIRRAERDRYIVQLRREGFPVHHIAMKLFLTERTIWRILARERKRQEQGERR